MAQNPAPPSAPAPQEQSAPHVIATTTEEVVLDLIVRDKKGRPVRDLKADELEIVDGQNAAKITSLRLTEVEHATASATTPGQPQRVDPLRQVRLVAMLFDSLSLEPAVQARAAAHELIKAGSGPNVYFAILRMAGRLQALQEFTNDDKKLNQAIDKLVGGKLNYQAHAAQVEKQLQQLAAQNPSADVVMPASSPTDANGKPLDPTAVPMASLLLNMLTTATIDANEMQSRPVLGALRAAADQLKALPGRKTIVYFTEGWNLTYAMREQFQGLISAANRANVSFYIVDASGLAIGAKNEAARKVLSQAIAAGANSGPAVSFEQSKSVDTALESLNANKQTALMDLAGSTGGMFISDSNDLRRPMQRLSEDVNAYYEVNYVPQGRDLDGHFRPIKVKVNRPGVKIQTRSGYFDLPQGSANLKGSWEVSALKALESNPAPEGFHFLANPFALRRERGRVTGELVYQIPISALESEENASSKTFRLRFGAVALFRDSNGKVIQKLSREVGHEGALESWERAKASNFSISQTFQIPPGAYSVEMAVVDAVSQKVSVHRMQAEFSANAGDLDLGGPIVVERLDPVSTLPETDPLRYEKGRVLPSLASTGANFVVDPKKQNGLPLFFLVRPAGPGKPDLALDLKRGGEPFTVIQVPLPESKAPVEIPYVATLPAAALGGGHFELTARLRQGDASVERKFSFDVAGEPRAIPKSTPSPVATGPAPEEDVAAAPVVDIVAQPLHADLRPAKEDEERILAGGRNRALEYTAQLPNFVCLQVTRRFEQAVSKKVADKDDWKELDTLSEQLTFVDGHERYQKVNGIQRGDDMGRGVLSAGEFGTLLRMVFKPESKTQFTWHDLKIENGKRLHQFEYRIPRATSQYMIRPSHNSPAIPVAAKGTVTIDEETFQIRQIQLAADGLPAKFPFQESVIEVDYDTFNVGEQFALLPKQASVRVAAGKKINRNAIEYLNYRKWGGTSELKFGDPVEPAAAPAPAPPAKKK